MVSNEPQTPALRSTLNPHIRGKWDPYYIGDIYARLKLKTRALGPVPKLEGNGTSSPYLDHVRSLSKSWHHLRYLADTLDTSTVAVKAKWLVPEDQRERLNRVKLCSLEWSEGADRVYRQDCNSVEGLGRILDTPNTNNEVPHARLIVVEDLSSAVIEALGSKFDIDPRFFKGHFGDYTWFNTRDPWFELPELASACRQRSFFNIRFVQGRYFENKTSIVAGETQAGSFNVLRRIDRDNKPEPWPDLPESDVGLIRSKMSLWVRPNKPGESGWLGVILLDPAISAGYPLWGGYEHLNEAPSFQSGQVTTEAAPQSIYDAFTRWVTSLQQEELKIVLSDPAVLTARVYLHIFSEWLLVLEYATTRLSHIEWELQNEQWRGPQGLDETLSKLQPWLRRIAVYVTFIKATKHELECRRDSLTVPKAPQFDNIMADVDGIYDRIQTLQSRADKIMNVATAITSIEQSKKAMQEARDVTRITYLAFVFVPISFTASFLSMTDFPSHSRVYWVFFVIAVPLSTVAVLIAANWARFENWQSRWSQRG